MTTTTTTLAPERLADLIHRANNSGFSPLDTRRRNNALLKDPAPHGALTQLSPRELRILLDAYITVHRGTHG